MEDIFKCKESYLDSFRDLDEKVQNSYDGDTEIHEIREAATRRNDIKAYSRKWQPNFERFSAIKEAWEPEADSVQKILDELKPRH